MCTNEKLKVIFLDVDGVLAYSDYENDETAHIDVEKVLMIKEICDSTGAKVVIISSWRGNGKHIPHIYHTLINVLTSNGVEVLGNAPHIECEIEGDVPSTITISMVEDLPYFKIKYGTGRAAEVQSWLKENPTKNFVILDDEDFGWADYGYDKYWIQPTWFGNGGLKPEHVDKAIKILNERK